MSEEKQDEKTVNHTHEHVHVSLGWWAFIIYVACLLDCDACESSRQNVKHAWQGIDSTVTKVAEKCGDSDGD